MTCKVRSHLLSSYQPRAFGGEVVAGSGVKGFSQDENVTSRRRPRMNMYYIARFDCNLFGHIFEPGQSSTPICRWGKNMCRDVDSEIGAPGLVFLHMRRSWQ